LKKKNNYPIANCFSVGTRKLCRNIITMIRIMGEKAIPPILMGNTFLILLKGGSVAS
jgi:hypothetical protein